METLLAALCNEPFQSILQVAAPLSTFISWKIHVGIHIFLAGVGVRFFLSSMESRTRRVLARRTFGQNHHETRVGGSPGKFWVTKFNLFSLLSI